jgi:signal transduction histidine kinase
VLVPILSLQAGVYYSRFQDGRTAELRANLEVARAVAVTFDEYLQDVLHQELAIGLAFTSPQPFSLDQGNQYLTVNAQEYPTVRDFEWISPQGVVLASSQSKAVGQDVADRPYVREIVGGQEWTVSDLLLEPITGEPAFVIARGVRGSTGALQGIVFTIVDAPHLGRVFRIERPGQGAFVITDRQGQLTYQRPEGALTWEQRDIAGDPMIRSALAGQERTGTFISTTDSLVWMGAVTPIHSVGWVARAGRPEAEVNAEILGDLSRDSVLFLLVAVGALLIALFVSRNITIPVSRVRQYAASLGSGGTVQPVEITGPREVEELSHTLSRMAEQIRDREQLLRGEVAELDNANVRLRDAQQRLVTEREQERKALARELHDQVIQDLVSCKFQLESLASDINPRADELTEVHDSIGMLIDDIRRICTDLRPPTIDSLGLGPAIQSYIYDWSARTSIATHLNLDASLGRLSEVVELSIFRIVQEGLSNIWKHARATDVHISLKRAPPNSVLILIADNGRGLGDNLDLTVLARKGHYGLLGISERVGLLGGHFQVQNRPGEGVLLEAEIPLPALSESR